MQALFTAIILLGIILYIVGDRYEKRKKKIDGWKEQDAIKFDDV